MNKSTLILILTLFLYFLNCKGEELIEKKNAVNSFLRNHFGKDLSHASKVVNIDKEAFFNLLLETSDSSLALKDMKLFWPINYKSYYDTVCFITDQESLTAFVRFFGGDTIWYTIGYFKVTKRDSLWITKRPTYKDITSYKDGKRHGLSQTLFPDGTKAYECMLQNGRPVDTVFSWHPNGIIAEFEVYKNGKSTFHKCFNEERESIECEGD